MKKGFCAVALLIFANGAVAQVAKGPEERSQGPAGGRSAADHSSRNESEGTDYTESASRAAKTAPNGQQTANGKIAEKKAGPWSGSVESRNEVVGAPGGASGGSVNDFAFWFRLNYALTSNLRVGVGQDLDHNLFNSNQAADERMVDFYDNDTFVRVTIPEVTKLPGGILLSTEGRVYIPDSGNSIAAGQTNLRGYLILSKDVGKFTFAYTAIARPALNTKDVYSKQSPDGSSYSVNATKAFRSTHILEALYKFNDVFSVYQDLGLDDIEFNGGTLQGTTLTAHQLTAEILETAMNFTPNTTFRVTAGVSTYEHDIRTLGWATYGPETRYFVSGAASFQ